MVEKAVYGFIPVIHKGYLKFFKENKGADLYLLSLGVLPEPPYLSRDLRTILDEELVGLIESTGIFNSVNLIKSEEDFNKLKSYKKITAPDEDISHIIQEKYLKDVDVDFYQTFLRFDGIKTLNKNSTNSDRKISREEFDIECLKLASQVSNKSSDFWRQIGGVAVMDGKILFSSFNQHMPSEYAPYLDADPRSNFNAGEHLDVYTARHAEIGLITQAAKEGVSLMGASIYVTTFPCPNCALALADTGIEKIYYGSSYSLLKSEDILKSRGIEFIFVEGE